MDPDYTSALRANIRSRGAAVLDTGDGKRLFMVHSTAMNMAGQGLLLAYEGGGTYFWEYATDMRPLTVYRLIGSGFSDMVAEAIMAILEGIDLATEMLNRERL